MSKKYFAFLVIPALILVVALMALPGDATATQLLGITLTPTPTQPQPDTPTPTEPQPDTPTPTVTVTEEPIETPTPTTPVAQSGTSTPRPRQTEVVLLPETGEFPIDPGQGIQWLFALTMIFLIGAILIRTFRTARIKK
jgi:outer membrane biosynthesis protein TonB